MKFTLHLILFLLWSLISSVAQTQVGTIKIDGHDLPIYVQQSQVDEIVTKLKATTPVITTPVVVTTPTTAGAKISSYRYEADKGFVLTFTINNQTPQEVSWDGVKYYPFSVVYLPAGNSSTYFLKSGSIISKIKVIAGAYNTIPSIQVPDSQPVVDSTTTTQTTTQTPITGNRPLIGAVRWDWWADNFECTTKWLSPSKYHYKAPFFAKETGENSLHIDGNTQEIFDKELAYASYAGIDYFAFDWYEGFNDPAGINGSYGMELFKRSANKGNIKMAYILESSSLGFSGEFSARTLKDICTDFGRDDYQKINGRPLFFYMTYPPLTPSQVDLINKTYLSIHPGKPLPYIVNAIQVGVQEAQMNNNTGIAAWSQYTGYSKEGDLKMRERYKAAGVKLIPTLTVGWDTRPIADNPCRWYQNAPYETEYLLKGEALKSHLIDTINFVSANPTICEANTILCYAWNENAEGGYIVPTLIPGTSQINTDTIEIFKQVLKPNQKEQ